MKNYTDYIHDNFHSTDLSHLKFIYRYTYLVHVKATTHDATNLMRFVSWN